jgi:hypothetical protein
MEIIEKELLFWYKKDLSLLALYPHIKLNLKANKKNPSVICRDWIMAKT